MKTTYYIARVVENSLFQPTIVESFNDKETASQYCDLMNHAGKGGEKGRFVVLEIVH